MIKGLLFFILMAMELQACLTKWTGKFKLGSLDVNFIELNLNASHFFQIDDHLNVKGHKEVADQLVKFSLELQKKWRN
jgi:hypothetical protein